MSLADSTRLIFALTYGMSTRDDTPCSKCLFRDSEVIVCGRDGTDCACVSCVKVSISSCDEDCSCGVVVDVCFVFEGSVVSLCGNDNAVCVSEFGVCGRSGVVVDLMYAMTSSNSPFTLSDFYAQKYMKYQQECHTEPFLESVVLSRTSSIPST